MYMYYIYINIYAPIYYINAPKGLNQELNNI